MSQTFTRTLPELDLFAQSLIANLDILKNVHDGKGYVIINDLAYKIESREFAKYCLSAFNAQTGRVARKADFGRVIETLAAIADSMPSKDVRQRMAMVQDKIYYDFANSAGDVVLITPNNFSTIKTGQVDNAVKLVKNANMKDQVLPQMSSDTLPDLLAPYIRLADEEKRLLIIAIVAMFVPNIEKPILQILGDEHSGKTFLTKMIKRIVDPCYVDLLHLSKDVEAVALALSSQYLLAFDNSNGKIPAEISDMLCQAVTEGFQVKRALYEDEETIAINLRANIAINSNKNTIRKKDLLDRVLQFKLETVDNGANGSKSELAEQLTSDLPQILWCIFETLQKAFCIVKNSKQTAINRFVDYERWCSAISIVLYGSEEIFLNAYKVNLAKITAISLSFVDIVAIYAERKFKEMPMRKRKTELYRELTELAKTLGVNTLDKTFWPQATNVLSTAIKLQSTAISERGITFGETTSQGIKYYKLEVNEKFLKSQPQNAGYSTVEQ